MIRGGCYYIFHGSHYSQLCNAASPLSASLQRPYRSASTDSYGLRYNLRYVCVASLMRSLRSTALYRTTNIVIQNLGQLLYLTPVSIYSIQRLLVITSS